MLANPIVKKWCLVILARSIMGSDRVQTPALCSPLLFDVFAHVCRFLLILFLINEDARFFVASVLFHPYDASRR